MTAETGLGVFGKAAGQALQLKLEAEKDKKNDSPLEPLEEPHIDFNSVRLTLDSKELWEDKFVFFKVAKFVVVYYRSNRILIYPINSRKGEKFKINYKMKVFIL